MALVAGVMFGELMTPLTYIQTQYTDVSQNGLDYVFAFSLGLYVTSTVSFIAYCLFTKNEPYMPREVRVLC